MLFIKIAAVTLGLALIVHGATQAGPESTDPRAGSADDKSRDAVDAWLKTLTKDKPLPVPPKIAGVDDAVHRFFPDERFYTIQFMRYPRAVKPPAPLKLENLVQVNPDGAVHRIENLDALKKLFEKKLAQVNDQSEARVALLALVRLAEEFYQDGYYTFTVPEQSVSVVRHDNHWVASGKAVVSKGGQGEITVTLTIGAAAKIAIEGKVRPDVRLR